jgi:hypothetical protein
MTRSLALALSIVLVVSATAGASPSIGARRPDVRLDDAWGGQHRLGRYRGMPTLVIYEDKDSASQNHALKTELSELARGDKYKSAVALIAIADVSSYNFWPARGFVKSAIQDESRKFGTLIFCDWDGTVRRSLGLRERASNVVLYGRDDRVRFSHAGPLSIEQRRTLIGLLADEVTSPRR